MKNSNLFIYLLYVLFIGLSLVFFSCNKEIKHNELWEEHYDLPNGSTIFIFHSSACNIKKPFFLNKRNMIDFIKFKYFVYDYCISEEEAAMLNIISRRNIEHAINEEEIIEETDRKSFEWFLKVIDRSNRDYKAYYSLGKNDIHKLKEPFRPPSR